MPESTGSPLYTAAQSRELDRIAIDRQGIPGYTLMCRAGEALADSLVRHWPDAHAVCVLCGPGNNGGDGYVLARLLLAAKPDTRVISLAAPKAGGDAARACQDFIDAGGRVEPFDGELPAQAGLFVDALLGTGLDRAPEGVYRDVMDALGRCDTPVLAADVPSGVNADSGCAPGVAVRAQVTVSFITRKRGLYTGSGPEYAGLVEFADLGVPPPVYEALPADVELMQRAPLGDLAAARPRGAHKGQFGHVLVVGGNHGMAGAARLAAEAAARCGAGLVSVATRAAHAAVLNAGRPELMVHAVERGAGLAPLLARASHVLVGPGLGRDAWAHALFETALESPLPLVVDADALNLLAADPVARGNWIITPHPGEAARLLETDTQRVQADRYMALQDLVARFGGVAVLKGSGSLIGDGTRTRVCAAGNPGMASGGMGDVLGGVAAALLAQRLAPFDAASAAVLLHAQAGDRAAARHGERGLLAGDLMTPLRDLLNAAH